MCDSDKLLQLKIYYLSTYADGVSSPDEMKRLTELRDNMKLSASSKAEFDQFCKVSVVNGSVLNKVQALLDEKSFSALHHDKQAQAETIWNLVNLGYADEKYSVQERQIITHLINRWGVDKLLVEEMVSAAEVILALVKQKEWAKQTRKPYAEIEAMVQEIDRNIASLYEDTKASVFDADIA